MVLLPLTKATLHLRVTELLLRLILTASKVHSRVGHLSMLMVTTTIGQSRQQSWVLVILLLAIQALTALNQQATSKVHLHQITISLALLKHNTHRFHSGQLHIGQILQQSILVLQFLQPVIQILMTSPQSGKRQ